MTLLSSMRLDSQGRCFLTYRDLEIEIPSETLKLNQRYLNGVPFLCFPAKTILFRYLTRGGIMKPKDDKKLIELEDYIVNHWNEEPPDDFYRPYLSFAKQMRSRYPNAVTLYNFYWEIDHLLGDRISGSSGFLYGLIRLFRT